MRINYTLLLLFAFSSPDFAKASFNSSTTLDEFTKGCDAKNIKKLAIVGCGYNQHINLNRDAHVHHQPAFYIDFDSSVSPNLRADICNEKGLSSIPDETFDEIYLERIGDSALRNENCFKNCLRILKKGGSLAFDEYRILNLELPSVPAELFSNYWAYYHAYNGYHNNVELCNTYKARYRDNEARLASLTSLVKESRQNYKRFEEGRNQAIEKRQELEAEIGQVEFSEIEKLMKNNNILLDTLRRRIKIIIGDNCDLNGFMSNYWAYHGCCRDEELYNTYKARYLDDKKRLASLTNLVEKSRQECERCEEGMKKAIEELQKLEAEIGQVKFSEIDALMRNNSILWQRSVRGKLAEYGLTNFRASGYYGCYGTEEDDVRPLETTTNPYNNRTLSKGGINLWVAKKREA